MHIVAHIGAVPRTPPNRLRDVPDGNARVACEHGVVTPAVVARTGLLRSADDRLVAGVCGGLAARWRLDPAVVRFAAMALSLTAGIGVVLYVVAWVALPVATTVTAIPAPASERARRPRSDEVAVLAIVVGSVLLLRSWGAWFSDALGLVGGIAIVGVTLVWGFTGETPTETSLTLRALRTAIGLVLILAGSVAIGALWNDAEQLVSAVLAAAVVGAGIWLLVGPTIGRLSRELTAERRARVRSEEKAEIAAHLHDSVLQTLAVIQQRASDQQLVSTLARRQERELRDWLYSPSSAGADTLANAARASLAEIEDTYTTRIEVVCVGDRPLDQRGKALVAALREATVNAVTHSGAPTVDVFIETSSTGVEAFVRDRGTGFDPESVHRDRRGIADSIEARMRRVGGVATVRSAPGEGTEVSFALPEDQS